MKKNIAIIEAQKELEIANSLQPLKLRTKGQDVRITLGEVNSKGRQKLCLIIPPSMSGHEVEVLIHRTSNEAKIKAYRSGILPVERIAPPRAKQVKVIYDLKDKTLQPASLHTLEESTKYVQNCPINVTRMFIKAHVNYDVEGHPQYYVLEVGKELVQQGSSYFNYSKFI